MGNYENCLYLEIKNYLLELIKDNSDVENYKLPSENQLVLKFHASRTSVRNALDLLAKNDLIYKRQGKGSFINTKKLKEPVLEHPRQTICLCVNNISFGGSSFLGKIISGVSKYCEENNLLLVIFESQDSQEKENQIINSLTSLNIAGLIIYPVNSVYYNKALIQLSLTKYPIVVIDRELIGLDINFVATDHYTLSYEATEFLINKGHKAITLLQSNDDIQCVIASINHRIKGYEDALNKNNIPVNPAWKVFKTFSKSEYDSITQINNLTEYYYNYLTKYDNINAILSLGGVSAVALIVACNRLPEERRNKLDVVFFDDEYIEIRKLISFRSYNILQNAYKIGYCAAEILHNSIQHPKSKRQSVLIPYAEIK